MRISHNFLKHFILSSLIITINSLTIIISENPKEKESSNKNLIIFTIESKIDQGYQNDKLFEIESYIYKDNDYETTKGAQCQIPKSPEGDFGDKIIITCELDVSSLNGNKIKFNDFKVGDSDLIIQDRKSKVLGYELTFQGDKKEEKKANYEFITQKIDKAKCEKNKFIFEIRGTISESWISEFTFDLILNKEYSIVSNCKMPSIYFTKDINIKCEIGLPTNINYYDEFFSKLTLTPNLYETSDKKILKFSLKGDESKIDFTKFKCEINKEQIQREEEQQRKWEQEKEEEKRKKREEEEREREEIKRRKEQEEYERIKREREEEEKRRKEKEEQEKRYNNYNNNEDKYRDNNKKEEEEIFDYNSNVKLIHLQVRYSYGYFYYMFYAMTPLPIGHKIRVGLTISKYNYERGYTDQDKKSLILKAGEEINVEERNIIVEYVGRLDCQECRKIILDKNSIQGAQVINIPDDEYALDAVATNKKNYLIKSTMKNPPLYKTENIFTQNCLIELGGSFFNRNRFFASKLPVILIGNSYYNKRNVTIYCGINERGIFSCPINENLNSFEYKLENLIIDQKENIIIDNSIVNRYMTKTVNCQKTNFNLYKDDNLDDSVKKKSSIWKKAFYIILGLAILYFLYTKCCGKVEEDYSEEYSNRWRVSSASYGSESSGLRGRW